MKRSSNRWYLLFILTLVYAFNHVDRQVMVILQEPIKLEFGLSDTQLGLLTGFLFAAFILELRIRTKSLPRKGGTTAPQVTLFCILFLRNKREEAQHRKEELLSTACLVLMTAGRHLDH